MNIQRKNSAHHFRMQSEREQTLGNPQLTYIYFSSAIVALRFYDKTIKRTFIHKKIQLG